mmetsp:Transcript_106937/g.268898  ORF Transcript_106937/g.268898 Transcript_106937/m.268898 type:complete len:236 (+) Transcript_106937:905-1612(+)
MGKDYYGVLGVPRTATTPEVREGYRRTAMKWHPQRNPGSKAEAEQRFRDIAEAYDVLIDPLRRRRYDDLGEKGLKFPPQGSGVEPYQYVGDPFALFASFFADANPLAAAYEQDYNGFAPGLDKKEAEKPIEVKVACTLAELQDGSARRVSVQRTRLGPDGKPFQESKLITLPVRAGWKEGMRVTFRGEGDHTSASKQPGDLIFVIEEKAFPGNEHVEAPCDEGPPVDTGGDVPAA